MKTLRVLHLDGSLHPWSQRDLDTVDFTIEVTSETQEDLLCGVGPRLYGASPRSRGLAAGATPALYDAVIIGNNRGAGLERARLIPTEMRPRTMIAWNTFHEGDEAPYRDLGFMHFGQRLALGAHEAGQNTAWQFLVLMASELPA